MLPDLEPSLPVDFHQANKSDCHELDEKQRISGVYRFLEPDTNELQRDFYERYCFFASEGPAWTVIQQRGFSDPPEDFQRTWEEYRAGFGNLSGDFWFGNEFTHKILYRDDYELRVELTDGDKQQYSDWAEYSLFRLDSEAYNYQLTVDGGFRGTLDDALELLNQVDFSTHDRRSDLSRVGASCSELYGGGWWFNECTESNLNGHQEDHQTAIIWPGWVSGIGQSGTRSSRMMIRPVVRATEEITDKNEV
ncbi:angiopoietin-related protein 1 isoform X1 [Drosophila bipectinata]|uniref:angiopoietin-related protein 1 isoform X1 n=1 Tax=Drosophila bipectinata TaxID=42026 RepID=UPI0038B25B2E